MIYLISSPKYVIHYVNPEIELQPKYTHRVVTKYYSTWNKWCQSQWTQWHWSINLAIWTQSIAVRVEAYAAFDATVQKRHKSSQLQTMKQLSAKPLKRTHLHSLILLTASTKQAIPSYSQHTKLLAWYNIHNAYNVNDVFTLRLNKTHFITSKWNKLVAYVKTVLQKWAKKSLTSFFEQLLK